MQKNLKERIDLLKTNLGSNIETHHDMRVHALLVLLPSMKKKPHQCGNAMSNGNFKS